MSAPQIDVYLVCNAKYHDTNFARLELLKLLAEHEDINTRVADSFSNIEAIKASTLLVTYTCDLRPTEAEQQGLADFLEAGGRWFALHATNALIEFVDGKADAPDLATIYVVIGKPLYRSPNNTSFTVRVKDRERIPTRGLTDFEADNEEPITVSRSGIGMSC